ncbi:hypothetical protein JTE90_007042 [Oedothorax gibbosus]|uniref:Uncharacterized protein n=1 Tax=Oedothorax gibbosus TaxID=931172 RepID=A0AAV6U5N7_9ARAC|nr:hypothetical protein JTE90_007042 [Oedothorax gibbosus]
MHIHRRVGPEYEIKSFAPASSFEEEEEERNIHPPPLFHLAPLHLAWHLRPLFIKEREVEEAENKTEGPRNRGNIYITALLSIGSKRRGWRAEPTSNAAVASGSKLNLDIQSGALNGPLAGHVLSVSDQS